MSNILSKKLDKARREWYYLEVGLRLTVRLLGGMWVQTRPRYITQPQVYFVNEEKMKTVLLVLMFLAVPVLAQNASTPSAAEIKPPQVSTELQLKIRNVQHDLANLDQQAQQISQLIQQHNKTVGESTDALTKLEDEAFTEAKLDRKAYTFDRETLTFKPAPKTDVKTDAKPETPKAN